MRALAVESGADALVVSIMADASLTARLPRLLRCPAIADAVGSRIEVHMDGGIRSGQDVLKALALGAKGIYIGRPSCMAWAPWARPE